MSPIVVNIDKNFNNLAQNIKIKYQICKLPQVQDDPFSVNIGHNVTNQYHIGEYVQPWRV
jgi:hypothetical protein